MRTSVLRSSVLGLAVLVIPTLLAQTVFIPDPEFRAELNQRVPGLVNFNGQMPLNNDALVPQSLILRIDWTPCDLTGLEYLQGVTSLDMEFEPGTVLTTLPVMPPTLRAFTVRDYPGTSEWPVMPALMQVLFVDGTDRPDLPVAPSGYVSLQVNNAPNITQLPAMSYFVSSLYIYNTGLLEVDLEAETLYSIGFSNNPQLTSVRVLSHQTNWQCSVSIQYCNALTHVDVQGMYDLFLENLPALTTVAPLDTDLDRLWFLATPAVSVSPALPANLRSLMYNETSVTEIPPLPAGLVSFSVVASPISTIPPLPETLDDLTVLFCPTVEAIPELPEGLSYLSLKDLPLVDELQPVPSTVARLLLSELPLSQLTHLPDSLDYLELTDLDITALPALPERTTMLTVENCPIAAIPALPDTLYMLRIINAPVQCLPWLPMGLQGLDLVNTQVACQPNHPPNANTVFPLCTILNSYCPEPAPFVEGIVFWDDNGNGVQDSTETGVANTVVIAEPYGYMTGTDSLGRYSIAVPIGSHSFSVLDAAYELDVLPAGITVEVTTQDTLISGIDFGAQLDTLLPELAITGWWEQELRPGFMRRHALVVRNNGTTHYDVTVRLTRSGYMELLSCDVPATVDGNDLFWHLDSLATGEERTFLCEMYAPPSVPLGSVVLMNAAIGPLEEDVDPSNNAYSSSTVMVGSYDPNDKHVFPSELTIDEGLSGRTVEYLIRFQNTGTASALRVLVTDTLEAGLDPLSFRLLGTSHACSWFFREGALHFLFEDIDLPDSTTNEPGSHGAIRFSMDVLPGLLPGDAVSNEANIYFDFNEPVITEPCVLAVELPQAIAHTAQQGISLAPVPSTGLVQLRTTPSWAGATFTVLDAAGVVVLSGSITGTTMDIDLRGRVGLYLLRMHGQVGSWNGRLVVH